MIVAPTLHSCRLWRHQAYGGGERDMGDAR